MLSSFVLVLACYLCGEFEYICDVMYAITILWDSICHVEFVLWREHPCTITSRYSAFDHLVSSNCVYVTCWWTVLKIKTSKQREVHRIAAAFNLEEAMRQAKRYLQSGRPSIRLVRQKAEKITELESELRKMHLLHCDKANIDIIIVRKPKATFNQNVMKLLIV